ncbi:MAG: cupin domain-containing protein [Candidatus Sericytochromatia bacterium]|nr:cupin domain-containing protein [Candidatus Tanganyikabacteria bacterium]
MWQLIGTAIGFGLGMAAYKQAVVSRERAEFSHGDQFHNGRARVYEGDISGNTVVKRAEQMARVAYSPAHPNPDFEGPDGGLGTTYVRWLFSEEPETAEGLLRSGITLIHDTTLPAGAAVGVHGHVTEEILYILEGTAQLKILRGDREVEVVLRRGDAQLTRTGEAHSIHNPGPGDLRLMVIGAVPRRA